MNIQIVHSDCCFLFLLLLLFILLFLYQEDQVKRVKNLNVEKFKVLDQDIQNKLVIAQTRREQMEREQKEKLRIHVSFIVFILSQLRFRNRYNHYISTTFILF